MRRNRLHHGMIKVRAVTGDSASDKVMRTGKSSLTRTYDAVRLVNHAAAIGVPSSPRRRVSKRRQTRVAIRRPRAIHSYRRAFSDGIMAFKRVLTHSSIASPAPNTASKAASTKIGTIAVISCRMTNEIRSGAGSAPVRTAKE